MSTFTFKRSRYTKKWVAFGPVDSMEVGAVIPVTRVDGSTVLKRVTSISKRFEVDDSGTKYAYAHTTYNDVCSSCQNAEIDPKSGLVSCQACAMEELGLLG